MSDLLDERGDALVSVLNDSRRLGFLGPGPVERHLEHAAGFADAVAAVDWSGWKDGSEGPAAAADLGSGGGLPGLPLALAFPGCHWILVESGRRRAEFLREAVIRLGVGDRVEVAEARAEEVGRSPTSRGRLDLVVARSFGPPAVVAECAAPLLRVGGAAVVSEPPGGEPDRWPAEGLVRLGMGCGPAVVAQGSAYQVLRQIRVCPDRYPRRSGVPAKRPLF